jgi:DNA-binding NarL/FixJ family response regulator
MEAKTETKSAIRVVIVDDHTVIRVMLSQIVETMGEGYRVIGQAQDAAEALQMCQAEKPDLVMLDLVLRDSSGLGLLKQIKQVSAGTHVLVFSGNLGAAIIRQALMAGADGLIGKGATLEEFKTAIRATSLGQTYLCGESSEAVRLLVSAPRPTPVVKPVLSQREQSVLRFIADGLSSKEIARKLGLSFYTVNNYRSKLIKKTGLHRAVQLSFYAAKIGLIDKPTDAAQAALARRQSRPPFRIA